LASNLGDCRRSSGYGGTVGFLFDLRLQFLKNPGGISTEILFEIETQIQLALTESSPILYFLILLYRRGRYMPSMLAAFCLFPPVRCSVRSMTNFSMSSSVMFGGTSHDIAGLAALALPLSNGRSSGSIRSPLASSTARSMTFCSSR